MVWVERDVDGHTRVWLRSAAALRAAEYLGGPWRLAAIAHLVPPALRDRVYDLIARHRHTLFGSEASCDVPQASMRARLLD
jgi:predicted DCC family thiol-disulfide oxidoreductase YuxK